MDEVRLALDRMQRVGRSALVVVCNAGVHPLPALPPGAEVFNATEGQLDLSSEQSVAAVLDGVAARLKTIFASESFSDIYVIPFGHAAISAAINLMIFRITGKTPKVYFHLGGGEYFILNWDIRQR
ncbi:hypothetical protein [Brevundimonas sp.]|uniref:hypothetical protein n=1 Tax=Brevundimonas sp. TaxID=1871086 RepID=UPI00262649F1|nr:hypothetical protein [Brevundimonas sp.]